MVISALPESTVRRLGCCVVITSPADVVKELVENAIDAGATSIEAAISPNCMDKISVRDNGHGIDVMDLEFLGRPSHTSKLKSFDELRMKGGQTLGFRGEALAAINSLAVVIMSTRTSDDPVATRMLLKHGIGGIENLSKTSAPVGTTVHVSGLFEKFPVRRQYALKNSRKSITRIKELMGSYALARPHIRLSLKVLGDAKSAWSYLPNRSPTIHEAVLQIFSKDLACKCIQVSHGLGSEKLVPLRRDSEPPASIILNAFLPAPHCSDKIARGKGAHVSVDSRPLSSTRGFAKKIQQILKVHLSSAMGSQASTTSLMNPFLQLNIICPPCSYDPNVTSLKDEVTFANEDRILRGFESLCRKLYPANTAIGRCPFTTPRCGTTSNGLPRLAVERSGADRNLIPLQEASIPDHGAPSDSDNAAPVEKLYQPEASTNGSKIISPSSQNDDDYECAYQLLQMRIKKRVNMARMESNTTDDACPDDSMPIRLPPLPQVSEVTSSRLNTGRRKGRSRGAIERYFQLSRGQDFEIALDETATAGIEQPTRRVLQPLSDSRLNSMQSSDESGTEDPRVMTNNGGTTGFQREAHLAGSPPPRRQPANHVPSPRVPNMINGLQTPPSSARPNRQGNPNPPFQSHSIQRNRAGHADVPRRSRRVLEEPHGGDESISQMRQSRVTSRLVTGQDGIRGETTLSDPIHRSLRTPILTQASPGVTLSSPCPPAYLDKPRRPRDVTGFASPRLAPQAKDRRNVEDFEGDDDAGERNTAKNHYNSCLRSTLLTNTPITSRKRKTDEVSLRDSIEVADHEKTPGTTRRYLAEVDCDDAASVDEAAARPRHQVNKKQRLQSHDSQPESSCEDLAPKKTDNKTETKSGSWLGPSFYLQEEASLPFKTMDEVRLVEGLLQKTVDAWLRRTNQDIKAVYTLQTAAKGKKPDVWELDG